MVRSPSLKAYMLCCVLGKDPSVETQFVPGGSLELLSLLMCSWLPGSVDA